jgi:DNA-binding MarR family transcriptional regulator
MSRCPKCGGKSESTEKEWVYSVFYVKQYKCLDCKKAFMEYYRDGKLSHIIPPLPSPRQKVLSYLRKNKGATEEELAEKLMLKKQEVLDVLSELEKEGKVFPTQI